MFSGSCLMRWCFAKAKFERTCDIWKEYNSIDSEQNSCIGSPYSALLVFACCDFIDRNAPQNFLWYSSCFLLLLWPHANLAQPWGSFWSKPLLPICVWCLFADWTELPLLIVFGVAGLDWTAVTDLCSSVFVNWTGLLLFLIQPMFSSNFSFHLPLVGRLELKLKR